MDLKGFLARQEEGSAKQAFERDFALLQRPPPGLAWRCILLHALKRLTRCVGGKFSLDVTDFKNDLISAPFQTFANMIVTSGC